MAKMDELAPFLLLKPGKEFEAVRNSYIESLTANLMSYQSRLVQVRMLAWEVVLLFFQMLNNA
jgi:hypothetical protein